MIVHVGEGTSVTLRLFAWLVVRRPGGDDESGRGLLLLDAVAARWGVTQHHGGKSVWCEWYGDAADSTGGSTPHT
ncbi:hypothetical protein [Streptomyces fulvoviolaceus]|uniref:hypothetical protein n=1 Tax=Streptomyces fulvoviolaceus TaxID=285535 RepID=UPI0030B803FF